MEYKIENNLQPEEYNELRKQANWKTRNVEITKQALDNSTIIKKATIDDIPVGMARVIGDGMYYLIVDVVISEKYQKQGIGKLLLQSIITEIKDRTKLGEACSINLVSVAGKEGFYEKLGFKKIPYNNTGYGMTLKFMK